MEFTIALLQSLDSERVSAFLAEVVPPILGFGVRLLTALGIFLGGRWLAAVVQKQLRQAMLKAQMELTLVSFACNIAHYATIGFIASIALGQLGFDMTSLLAIIGAAGLAIGLALQGSLANLSAGIVIVIFRPFRVNDWIAASGILGKVEDIQIFATVLRMLDNRAIVVPNKNLMESHLVNYSANGKLRLDLTVPVRYEADLLAVKDLLLDVLEENARVKAEPAPVVKVFDLGDHYITLLLRAWTDIEHYWDLAYDLQEGVKLALDRAGIEFPHHRHKLQIVDRFTTIAPPFVADERASG